MSGAARARGGGRASVEADARSATVVDLEGGEHRLEELWRDRPVVLVFLRHFG